MSIFLEEADILAVRDTFTIARNHGFDETIATELAAEALVARRTSLNKPAASVEVLCTLTRAGLLKGFQGPCQAMQTPDARDGPQFCATCLRPIRNRCSPHARNEPPPGNSNADDPGPPTR